MTYAEKIERQKDRAAARADRRRDWAAGRREETDAAFGTAQRIGSAIPFGQPILVGHHSEHRHRRDIERIDGAMRRSVESTKMADYHEERAAAAERRIEQMERPDVTLRRLERLRKDERTLQLRVQQYPDVERYRTSLAETQEAIAYWEGHMATLQAAGVKVWTRADFAKGDVIIAASPWGKGRVLRVNPKTLTVELLEADYLPECMRKTTIAYDRIKAKV